MSEFTAEERKEIVAREKRRKEKIELLRKALEKQGEARVERLD